MKLLKHVPNALTISRILLVYIFIPIFFYESGQGKAVYSVSLAVLTLSALTDVADGFIARKFHCESDFGRLCDPLADKLTQCVTAVCLCIDGIVPLWVPAVFLVKEIAFVTVAALLAKCRATVVSSNFFGKMASVVFYVVVALGLVLAKEAEQNGVYIALCAALVAFSAVSTVAYFIRYASSIRSLTQRQ